MTTICYSLLHFLVDLCCAYAMFRFFGEGSGGYANVLLYNFCAFALQMPLGALLDGQKRGSAPRIWAAMGVICTALGSLLHPALLGLGNALFHVGGGVGVIREDSGRGWKGRALGVFVAPGALGLYLGGQMAGFDLTWVLFAALMLSLVPLLRLEDAMGGPAPREEKQSPVPMICCFVVVALRSWVGLSVGFAWKQGFWMGLIAVCAVVLGKAAGGFASARFGAKGTVIGSLGLACVCYLVSDIPLLGIFALFFFNMSMPITLYQLWLRHRALPGFSFGLLTFALFLGFLPVYMGWSLPVSGGVFGAVGSLVSLVLLLPVCEKEAKWT